jgi:hypothetical protein
MPKVTVDGNGSYEIPHEKIAELLGWLSRNQGVKLNNSPLKEVQNNQFPGSELLEG